MMLLGWTPSNNWPICSYSIVKNRIHTKRHENGKGLLLYFPLQVLVWSEYIIIFLKRQQRIFQGASGWHFHHILRFEQCQTVRDFQLKSYDPDSYIETSFINYMHGFPNIITCSLAQLLHWVGDFSHASREPWNTFYTFESSRTRWACFRSSRIPVIRNAIIIIINMHKHNA